MTQTPNAAFAVMAAELAEGLAIGQTAGLLVLRTELEALAQVMPGMAPHRPATEAELQLADEAVEDGFENMPV